MNKQMVMWTALPTASSRRDASYAAPVRLRDARGCSRTGRTGKLAQLPISSTAAHLQSAK